MDGVTTYPYYVSNRAYVSKSPQSIGDKIDLKQTKWADLMADTPPILKANGEKLDGALYGVLRTPQANNVDISTPLGLPIFAEAIEELKDLDIAYSRNAGEIFDSQKIVLADDRLLMPSGTPVSAMSPQGMENRRNEMNLPLCQECIRTGRERILSRNQSATQHRYPYSRNKRHFKPVRVQDWIL